MENITTMKITEANRDWLESVKRKLDLKSFDQVISKLKLVVKKFGLMRELK